jgi:uncharacterized membrane protein
MALEAYRRTVQIHHEVATAMPSLPDSPVLRHPVNIAMEIEAPLGARVADRVTGFLGSWRFVAIQTTLVVVWIAGNIVLLFHFDPYPFILLNLAFSTQAAYAAPLILLASNRSSHRDRLTLEHAAGEADVEEGQNEELLTVNRQILERVVRLEETILVLERSIQVAIDRVGRSEGGRDPSV